MDTSLFIRAVSLTVFLLVSSVCHAQSGDDFSKDVTSEFGFHLGNLLPAQIDGVTEIMPLWGVHGGYRFREAFSEFGGIVAVLVGNARKAFTIVISLMLFPKPSSWLYVVGGLLVFGSLVGNAFVKDRVSGASAKKGRGKEEGEAVATTHHHHHHNHHNHHYSNSSSNSSSGVHGGKL